MAEFFKERQREATAEQEWRDKFRASFERALDNIERHQERRLLNLQVVLLAFIGGFLIDVLASSVYDLLVSINSQLTFKVIITPVSICFTSIIILVAVFLVLRRQFLQYKPSQPILGFRITPEDTKPFLEESVFHSIVEYLEKGELKDFKTFGNNFFESLRVWFSHLFNDKVIKEPIRKSEELGLTAYKEFPTMIREYDISPMSPMGVKTNLEVVLAPHVIYEWTNKGDKTATRSFYIIFRFKIMNPEHGDAKNFLDDYYHLYAGRVIAISSYCVRSAFQKLRKASAQEIT